MALLISWILYLFTTCFFHAYHIYFMLFFHLYHVIPCLFSMLTIYHTCLWNPHHEALFLNFKFFDIYFFWKSLHEPTLWSIFLYDKVIILYKIKLHCILLILYLSFAFYTMPFDALNWEKCWLEVEKKDCMEVAFFFLVGSCFFSCWKFFHAAWGRTRVPFVTAWSLERSQILAVVSWFCHVVTLVFLKTTQTWFEPTHVQLLAPCFIR